MDTLAIMRARKWFGLAGLAGVVATGVVIARSERQRRAYTPDQVRDRLHEKYAQITAESQPAPGADIHDE